MSFHFTNFVGAGEVRLVADFMLNYQYSIISELSFTSCERYFIYHAKQHVLSSKNENMFEFLAKCPFYLEKMVIITLSYYDLDQDYRKCVVSLLRYIKKLEGEGGNLEHKRVMVLVPHQDIWMEDLKSFFLVTNKRRHRGSFEIYVTTYEDVNTNPPPEFLWEYIIFDASGRRLSESKPVLDKLKAKFKLLITDYPEVFKLLVFFFGFFIWLTYVMS